MVHEFTDRELIVSNVEPFFIALRIHLTEGGTSSILGATPIDFVKVHAPVIGANH
jgi:hypothetical protein